MYSDHSLIWGIRNNHFLCHLMKHFLQISGLILLFILASLACNFPTATSEATDPSLERLRQTLDAGIYTPPQTQTASPAEAKGDPVIPVIPTATAQPSQSNFPLFPGLQTATPGLPAIPVAIESVGPVDYPPIAYITRSGDTLPALVRRFGVDPSLILSRDSLPSEGLIDPNLELTIPDPSGPARYPSAILPDSEVVDSPSAADFSIEEYIQEKNGFLSAYTETVDSETLTGAQIVRRVSLEHSVNPRLLLAFLEFRSGWVLGQPASSADRQHPIGFYIPGYSGLYKELALAAKQINTGYYGWRTGELTRLDFPKNTSARLSPQLNAGSVAVQFLFSRFHNQTAWGEALYGSQGFLILYQKMFGDPWGRAARFEPLFPAGLQTVQLELPFQPGERWSFTAGPHSAFSTGDALGALDFSPVTGQPPCAISTAWATASAPGVIVRADSGGVVLDLDGDGLEQTGWDIIYMHLAVQDRVRAGTRVQTDDRLGHPSCEGGNATGSHVHIARKYNGEWIAADGPLPFILSGWEVHAELSAYFGTLTKGDQLATARSDGSHSSTIMR